MQKLLQYPVFSEDTIFYRYPNREYSIQNISTNFYRTLSLDGLQVFEKCNGLKNVHDIAIELQEEFDIEDSDVLSFFEDAEKRGFVYFSDKPIISEMKVKGNGKYFFPRIFSIELTNKCNLDCCYCYGNHDPAKKGDLPFEKIEWLFQLLKDNGVEGIELTGGEPLMHPQFYEILKLAKIYFGHINILSNGILFDQKIFDFLKSNKKGIGVQISIDGSNEEIFSKLRRKNGTFQKTISVIKQLLEIGVFTRVGIVATWDNMYDLKNTCQLMRDIGVTNFMISKADSLGRGASLTYPDGKTLDNRKSKYYKEFMKIMEEINSEYEDILFNISRLMKEYPNDNFNSHNCGTGWSMVTLEPNGDVKGCILLDVQMAKLGNIFTDNYLSIFNDSSLSSLYQIFHKDDNEKVCEKCKYKTYCAKCLAKIILANKDRLSEGKQLCPIAQKFEFDKVINFDHDYEYKIDLQ